jgi:hypothetical protein
VTYLGRPDCSYLIRVRALSYDFEANLPALEAVIEAAEHAGAVGHLVGGDAVSSGPWPVETFALLRTLPDVWWVRGNGGRWMLEPPEAETLRHGRGRVPRLHLRMSSGCLRYRTGSKTRT